MILRHILWFSVFCDVQWRIASIQFGAIQSGFSALTVIGFVYLRYEQCIKSKQAVGIGSFSMSVYCKPWHIPCQHVKVIVVYRNAHHAKSSPGNETVLHGMTMHHLWVANFLAFLSWKKEYVLQHLWDHMFYHSWRKMFISGLSWNILTHFPLLVKFLIRHSFCFMQIKVLRYKSKLGYKYLLIWHIKIML